MNNKKEARYQRIYDQLYSLMPKCSDPLSQMASIAAVLHHKMDNFFWTGFYLFKDGGLYVGPYQGPLACMKLERNKGVCWAAVNNRNAVVVKNVHEFPGHIACDSRSNSEITVPVYNLNNEIVAVLDIDSREFSNFDETDTQALEKIVKLIYSEQ
jgi:L-methionine (R)-S-oxide reductase